jgi:diguanylate cyclase (GGDEF)-like protein/PAS domain S-box-containing protein
MKLLHPSPSIPTLAIAISAMILGFETALRPPSHSAGAVARPFLFGVSAPAAEAITGIALLLVGLIVLKLRMDWHLLLERDLLNAFLEHIPDNVYFKDRQSRFIRINRAMAAYFGLADPSQAMNKTDADIFSSEHAGQAFKDEQEIIRTGQPILGIEEMETWPDGRQSWVLTTKVPLRARGGRIIGTMGISHNITERKEAEERIHYMALHDSLTGLPNRILLADRLAQVIALAHRNRRRVAVLMLDLDRFKSVNDSYGHYVGDRLLEGVAARLKGCLRDSDIVARLGGDEFVIVLPEVDDNGGVEEVARKVLTSTAQPFHLETVEVRTSASIGICQYPIDGENPESLLQIADSAMYEAKKMGRNTYSFFTPELTEATRRRQKLEADLHRASERGELTLHYQPLVGIDSGRITAVEALLRWRHTELGTVSPQEFVPMLEELGLIVEVGRWVLKTACLQSVAWQKKGLPFVRMAVNISAAQFYQDDIAETVKSVLRETGMDPQGLELELTESLTLGDSESAVRIMHELRQIGVSLSLDDFGTGWSSLSCLRRLPLDRIKIDRSFLRDIESEPDAEAVVDSILSLGRHLGLPCVAEGVETREQLMYLQGQKCDEMQGFLYSQALPAGDCEALMRTKILTARIPGGCTPSSSDRSILSDPAVLECPVVSSAAAHADHARRG